MSFVAVMNHVMFKNFLAYPKYSVSSKYIVNRNLGWSFTGFVGQFFYSPNIFSMFCFCLQLIAPYSVTKTALIGLSKALAGSLADDNIRVNAIAPGVIKTKFAAMVSSWSFVDLKPFEQEFICPFYGSRIED